jgi:3-methyladenine DNA glycosylase AlkD
MSYKEIMAELKAMGTAQNVKIYRRHGAVGELYGVSFANLGSLKKKIKVDHALAEQLWKSGNHDARTLATMIADPARFTVAAANTWVKELNSHVLADLLAGLLAKSPAAKSRLAQWTKAPDEIVRQFGYALLAAMLRDNADLSDSECAGFMATIEKEIHGSPNWARHSMNMALAAIGIYKPALRVKALETAARIGKVEVDHGETSCKTPDAADYIKKAAAHAKSKKIK